MPISLICGIQTMTQMNLSMKQKQNHGHREQTGDCPVEGVGGEMEWEVGISRCELLYTEWINNKVLMYSTENYIQYLMIKHSRKEHKKNIHSGPSGKESAYNTGDPHTYSNNTKVPTCLTHTLGT